LHEIESTKPSETFIPRNEIEKKKLYDIPKVFFETGLKGIHNSKLPDSFLNSSH